VPPCLRASVVNIAVAALGSPEASRSDPGEYGTM